MFLANKDIDYYELLRVSRNAPVEVIRASYRTLMQKLKHHPDLGGDVATAALINEAYAVLCDEKRRAEHDAHLEAVKPADEGIDVRAPPSEPDRQAPETPETPETMEAPSPDRECVFCRTEYQHGMAIVEDTTCITCSSPLFPADNRRLELTGQRAVTRIDKRQEIIFYTQWPQAAGFTAQTEDISLNGMRFVTDASMVQGQYIKIVSQIVEAVGQVSNLSLGPHGLNVAGVAFVTLQFRQSLGGFVSERI